MSSFAISTVSTQPTSGKTLSNAPAIAPHKRGNSVDSKGTCATSNGTKEGQFNFDPLANFKPASSGMSGFSGQQQQLGIIQIIAEMMMYYESSQTDAATADLQVNTNLESSLSSQTQELVTNGTTEEDLENTLNSLESRDGLKYAMQAVMALLATSIGFLIGGPVGAAVALTVCAFDDIMSDTGGWDKMCSAIDNAVGVSGEGADALNAAIKLATSLVVGLASGGAAGIGMAVEDVCASALTDVGEDAVGKTLSDVVKSGADSITKQLTGTMSEDELADGGDDLVADAGKKSDGEIEGSSDDEEVTVEAADGTGAQPSVEEMEQLSEESELERTGDKQVNTAEGRKASIELQGDIDEETGVASSDPTTGEATGRKKPKIGKRTISMGIHEGIQVLTSFKTEDGQDGEETGFVGDVVLACGGPQWLASVGDLASDFLLQIGDLVMTFGVMKDTPTMGMKMASKFMKGLTLISAGTEGVLSGLNGFQQLHIANELRQLAPITQSVDEEMGTLQATMMEEQQNSQALSTLMDTTEQWAGLVSSMLQAAFAPEELILQA